MNINAFFLFLLVGLSMIFFLFEPIKMQKKEFSEIATLELNRFQLSELNTIGLTSVLNGENGLKYTDRYIINGLSYMDNTNKYIATIESNSALYKGFHLDLSGDIKYIREDGLTFITQKARYDKQTSTIATLGTYKAQFHKNNTQGTYLEYNNEQGIMKSKDVTINYILKERK